MKKLPRNIYLTAAQAYRALKKGGEGFLVYAMSTEQEVPSIDLIPVVNEFKDVFPDEFPGLPLSREVEFEINLIMGAEPIVRSETHSKGEGMNKVFDVFCGIFLFGSIQMEFKIKVRM